ncbi:MAG: beta-galactosidase, partial [Clostridia bacterium]|nr:beta-galactosidase [Clostridia bacterium]
MRSIPRPEHPNPQWERAAWRSLNGTWQFEIDNGVSGEARGLHKAKELSGAITVPFCPESSLSGVGNKDFMRCVWYKRIVSFTKKDLAGKRVILHFGACDFETRLFVNGERVGLPHIGGYGSFSFEITKFVKPG